MARKTKKTQAGLLKPDGTPIKFGTIVPLIGGMTVANSQVVGTDPSFLLSYPGFGDNDSHCRQYFSKTPYIIIDPETNEVPEDSNALFEQVDFVSAVCPCAGLSMLNANNSKGDKKRGADAAQNDWMYKSAKFVLEHVKPTVFWGENAPGLYTEMGRGVAEKLKEIGAENGYSFSMIKTDTFLHGIPQHRIRTFYFFWKDSEAPILGYHLKETPRLADYLAQVPANAKHMDVPFGLGSMDDNPWAQFLKFKGMDMKTALAHPATTVVGVICVEKWIDDAIEWGAENSREVYRLMSRAKEKFADSKGIWDASPILAKDSTNAIIAKNAGVVHPNGERGITVREAMWLMGLPHDFNLVEGKHWNHISQNVPVRTASDWTLEVVRFIKGEITEFGGTFLKQNNITQRIDFADSGIKAKVLF